MTLRSRTRLVVPLIWIGNLFFWTAPVCLVAWAFVQPPHGVAVLSIRLALGIASIIGMLAMVRAGDGVVERMQRSVALIAPGILEAHGVSPDVRLEQSIGGLRPMLDVCDEPAVAANPELAHDAALLRAIARSKSCVWFLLGTALAGLFVYAVAAVFRQL